MRSRRSCSPLKCSPSTRGREDGTIVIARFANLAVASDVPFPGLSDASGPPDITIREADLPACGELIQRWPDSGGGTWLSIARAADDYCVTLPGLACVISHDGRRVDYAPLDSDPATRVHLLLHQVLPLAVSRTGRLVLHACAVETPAGAIAFLGESGAGKSTMAAALCARGFPLVADDALVVDVSRRPIAVWPTADGLRLWTSDEKLRVRVALARDPSALVRIYLLSARHGPDCALRDAPQTAARLEMLSHLFRLDITDREESRRVFDDVNDVAAGVPARVLTCPDDLALLDRAVECVLRDLADSRVSI
jgi:hypothetical protein